MVPSPSRRGRHGFVLAATLLSIVATAPRAHAVSNYTLFESGQVRPLALSPNGTRLFAVNTPDNRLEIFNVLPGGLTFAESVPVGLEPSAVAARSDGEVWVVNHLSDSISVVNVGTPGAARVTRTLLVGDEPRDIVFANGSAFITTAHRGQNTPLSALKCVAGPNDGAACTTTTQCPGGACTRAELTKAGVGRADVWVFDPTALGSTLGGTPSTIITLFGDTPRALTVSADGNTVYAAVFQSGNQTTTVNEGAVPNGGTGTSGPTDCSNAPGGLPGPNDNFQNIVGPETGLIVKVRKEFCIGGTNSLAPCTATSQCPGGICGGHFRDELDRCWDAEVRFALPDEDVFKIDATQNPPVAVAGAVGIFDSVGTVLFNMAVNPVNGKVYVTNTEAKNDVRFEGPGVYAAGFKPFGEPPTVRGHLAESRITVLDTKSVPSPTHNTVESRHLNKHIDYDTCCAATPNAENDASLAFPLGMAVSSDGQTLYVAAFGSSKVGVFNTTQLEDNTFVPSAANQISVSGGGPTGIVLDEAHTRLYVMTRFDNAISVVKTGSPQCVGGTNNGAACTVSSECPGGTCSVETAHIGLHNPEPASVVDGRPILYDASFTSSHGDSACASCHIFGDFDSLAWDLGNPDDTVLTNPGPFKVGPFGFAGVFVNFHPMKGPMTTQSLRGMANHGPMHWRGDRTGGNDATSAQPDSGTFNEDAAFKKFNVAFPGLLGRSAQLQASDMQAFTDFILQVTYPPNPIRNLDNSLTTDEQAGKNFYTGPVSDTLQKCEGCHRLDPNGNASFGVAAPGFFGTDGQQSFENETQHLKIPHLRNLYQKVGMFGMPFSPFINAGDNGFMFDQIRGFGFLHDGSVDTTFRFHNATVFNQGGFNAGGIPAGAPGDPLRRQIEAFMLAFDTNLAPIVGQQITRPSPNGAVTDPRITLMIQRADAGECDVVAKFRTTAPSEERGALYAGSGQFVTDRATDPPLSDAALRTVADTAGQEVTYTAVPRGSGLRIGIDRDGDTFGDQDEIDAGSDPEDPGSTPPGGVGVCATLTPFLFQKALVKDSKGQIMITAKDVPLGSYSQETVSVLANDGGGTIFSGNEPGVAILPVGSGFRFRAPRGATGITGVTLKARGNTPTLFKVTFKTKAAWIAPAANETTGSTFLMLNIGGRCFRGNATKIIP